MRGDTHFDAELLLNKSALQVGTKEGLFFFSFFGCYLLKRIGGRELSGRMINGERITPDAACPPEG